MARCRLKISTRVWKTRWPIVDLVESLAKSGLQDVVVEEVEFAGKGVDVGIPLEPGLSSDGAHAVVDVILERLSGVLGGNAARFTGNFLATASATKADEAQIQESLARLSGKGLAVNLEPVGAGT